MIVIAYIFGLSLLLLWLPLTLAWIPMMVYTLYVGRIAPVVIAVLFDWYYVASVPYLTLCALCIAIIVPFVRSRLMFYTT